MSQPLLEGQIESPESSELRELARRLDDAESEIQGLREQLRQVVSMAAFMKRQLAPLFSGEQGKGSAVPPADVNANTLLDKWRNRFGPTGARLIDVLEVGPSTRNKLRPALQCGWSTLDALLKKFKDVGLIERDGDSYRLRF